MIVLDSNVILELMRPVPDATVVAWLDRQPAPSVWTTSISVFEVRFGLRLLPDGKKRRTLEKLFEKVLHHELSGRVLAFDTAAALASAELAADFKSRGIGIDLRDLQIAGIVSGRRGSLATRNTRHFAETGIMLINPWEDPGS